MKVFISWSGKRSKETAEALSLWIRQVIQAAETWISLDIEKGTRWNEKINKELEETKVGIICLNHENLSSEWILFEAGALSKTSDAHVCTFLLDINPVDIKAPLGQFQHTLFIKEEVKKLIHTINNKIVAQKEKTLPDQDIDEVFEIFWPILEGKLNTIKSQSSDTVNQERSDRDILEEILQIVRANNITSFPPDIVYKALSEDNKESIQRWLKKINSANRGMNRELNFEIDETSYIEEQLANRIANLKSLSDRLKSRLPSDDMENAVV